MSLPLLMPMQMDIFETCLDKLAAFSKQSQGVITSLCGADGDGESAILDMVTAVREPLGAALNAASQSVPAGCQTCTLLVATTCIWEASRIVFPEPLTSQTSSLMSAAALKHLANLTAAISECVSLWTSQLVNVFDGEAHFLPSALMWVRSMQHLFQWVLRRSGAQLEAPLPVYLLAGVSGHSDPSGSPHSLREGPAAACSGLLLSQHIGASRGEILPGCLPATVALARLLCAQGCCGTLGAECQRTSIVVPEGFLVPSDPPSSDPAALSDRGSDGMSQELHLMAVKHVRLGSQAACEVAKRHLEGVLKAVTVRGMPIALSGVQGPSDVAGSETLWLAVRLWRQLQ